MSIRNYRRFESTRMLNFPAAVTRFTLVVRRMRSKIIYRLRSIFLLNIHRPDVRSLVAGIRTFIHLFPSFLKLQGWSKFVQDEN